MSEPIRSALADGVLTVTLARPEKKNALTVAMYQAMTEALVAAKADAAVRAVLITGQPGVFTSGNDIEDFMSRGTGGGGGGEGSEDSESPVFRFMRALLDCDKPVIAKLNGHATGLGATIALFCDVIFAAEHAKIGDPHVSVGLTAGDGGAVIWPQLIGYARAKEYLMTGDLMPAPDAARIGLINHAVPAAELDARVEAFADRLAGGALQAIRTTKLSVNIGLKQLAHSIMDASIGYEGLSNRSHDHQEAVRAFPQKRTPSFIGR